MRRNSALIGLCRNACPCACFAIALYSNSLPAAEIYHLDFTQPEVGAYEIVAGNPSLQSSAGSLTDVLAFHATPGGEQIQLPVGVAGSRYELHYDLLMHGVVGSDYAFVMRLNATGLRSLNFHGGLNSIYAYQTSPFINQTLAPVLDDRVYHIGITVDAGVDFWSVAIDGVPASAHPLNGASLQSIGFGLAPWIGGALNDPNMYVAIDNIVLTVVPEPSAATILLIGLLTGRWCVGRRTGR
ncbi:MAG: hypothetical protein H7Y43_03315 [Akkermansiaceae bacterium]|nr:hypothetical protein [Verrucomicrobiales bacterium]